MGAVILALGGSDCERLRDGWLAQPVNALTSAAFVAMGILVAARALAGRRTASPAAAWFALLLGAIGAGSLAFHGPQPAGARVLHDVPIALTAAFVLVTTVRRRAVLRENVRRRRATSGVLFVATGAAVVSWVLGRTTSPACAPDSAFQWHGLWHVLAAVALGVWAANAGITDGVPLTYARREPIDRGRRRHSREQR